MYVGTLVVVPGTVNLVFFHQRCELKQREDFALYKNIMYIQLVLVRILQKRKTDFMFLCFFFFLLTQNLTLFALLF